LSFDNTAYSYSIAIREQSASSAGTSASFNKQLNRNTPPRANLAGGVVLRGVAFNGYDVTCWPLVVKNLFLFSDTYFSVSYFSESYNLS